MSSHHNININNTECIGGSSKSEQSELSLNYNELAIYKQQVKQHNSNQTTYVMLNNKPQFNQQKAQ